MTLMLPVAVAVYGTIPSILQYRMKKNIVSRKGMYVLPDGPMTGMMTSSRRKTMMVSRKLASPVGTRLGRRKQDTIVRTSSALAIHIITT